MSQRSLQSGEPCTPANSSGSLQRRVGGPVVLAPCSQPYAHATNCRSCLTFSDLWGARCHSYGRALEAELTSLTASSGDGLGCQPVSQHDDGSLTLTNACLPAQPPESTYLNPT